ncbi:MAG TPA: amidohydrolase family protein [Vicinamibacteria bacterium]|nr:amidohydrolase family protein [Vicinamibacteria bacterium]
MLFVMGTTAASQQEPDKRALVLDGATLFDGTGAPARTDSRIVVAGETIRCVGDAQSCPMPAGARRERLVGHWILPGLVDAHVHFSQTGWFDGRPDALDFTDELPYEQVQNRQKRDPRRYYDAYLCSGVTAVFDVGGFPWSWDLRAPAEHDPTAPHVAAAGPLVTHAPRADLNLPGEKLMIDLSGEAAGREIVRYLSAFGSDAVKVWFLEVEDTEPGTIDARVLAVGDEAASLDLPLIVHATSLREAKVALRAGASLLVHGVEDVSVDDEFLSLAQANGTIYTPTLIVSGGYLRMFEAVKGVSKPRIDDPNGCMDSETRKLILSSPGHRSHPSVSELERNLDAYRERLADSYERKIANLLRVHRAGIPLAVGTDAGNPGTFHGPSIYAELEAMQAAGIEPPRLLVMATRNGARAMNRDDIGTIEPGKIADLIVVSADPTIDVANLRHLTHVVRAGKLHRFEELKRGE